MNAEFKDRFAEYNSDILTHVDSLLSAEDIHRALTRLHTGKSPGHDQIMTEHVVHCHPVIYTLLAKLFNLMIASGFVPNDFGMGVLIPIPKSDASCGTHKLNNFRGITLSPIISKIFEHCILYICYNYFERNDN